MARRSSNNSNKTRQKAIPIVAKPKTKAKVTKVTRSSAKSKPVGKPVGKPKGKAAAKTAAKTAPKVKGKGKAKVVQQKPVKAFYAVDEKVLCYEPDPTKAKILYEAKVLQVVKTENRGKPVVEYLIHFQGWNSSWDRFVPEDLILKDDETNRALQLKLAEQAEAMFQASPTKSSKKRGRSVADLVRASLRGHGQEIAGPKVEKETTSDDEESAEEPDDHIDVELPIPHAVRMAVDLDFFLINKYEKLTQLPAEPNVVQLLEEYVRHFGFRQLSQWVEALTASAVAESLSGPNKTCNAPSSFSSTAKRKPDDPKQHPMEKLYNRLRVVKEVAEGIRTMIDFLLPSCLLYDVELEQFAKCDDKTPFYHSRSINPEDVQIKMKEEVVIIKEEEPSSPTKGKRGRGRSRAFEAERPAENGPVRISLKKLSTKMNPMIRDYKKKLIRWTLVSRSIYERVPSLPSLIYGPNFLLRLFVKLPEIWGRMVIPNKKLRVIIHYLTDMIDFVIKRNFCGPHLYMPAKNALKRVGRRRRPQSVPLIRVERAGSDEEEMPDIKLKVEKL